MPMLFEMFAPTGGKPNASSVGNVIRDPEPTIVLIVPAATPARKMATTSQADTGADYLRAGQPDLGSRLRSVAAARQARATTCRNLTVTSVLRRLGVLTTVGALAVLCLAPPAYADGV